MFSKILIFVLIAGTTAITWRNKLPAMPNEFANKTGCYIKELNDVIGFDDSVDAIGYCYLIHCTQEYLEYLSCGVNDNGQTNCYVTEQDSNAPYPRCCPILRCLDTDLPWERNAKTYKK